MIVSLLIVSPEVIPALTLTLSVTVASPAV